MPSSLIALLVLIGHTHHVVTQSGKDATDLNEQLFRNDSYNKKIRPIDNQSHAIDVYVNLYLLAINDISETDHLITTTAFLSVSWNDSFLKWEPNEFGGIKFYHWPQNDVWKPDIALHNSHLDYKGLGEETLNVLNIHTGAIYWHPFQVFRSSCSMDIFYFPFDYQTCFLRFQAWSYSRRQVNIDSGYKNSKGFYLDYYKTNSEWDIDNTSWHIYRDKQDAAINFKITLKRKPMYFMMSILLPICMLSILNICVFVIPVNSGEKASYAVTVFLSFAVFLTIISDTFPKNSESIPLFTTFLVMQTTVSAITTILALVLSRLESFGDAKVPGLLVKLMKMRSCRPRRSRGNRTSCRPCLSRGNKSKVHVIEPTEDAENSTDSLKNDHTVKVEWKDAVNFLDFVFFVLFSVMLIVSIITFLYFAASKGKVYNEEFNYTSNGQYEQHDNSGHGSGNDGGLDSGQDSGHGSGHDDGGNNDQTDNYYNYYYYDRDDYHNNYY